MMSCIIVDDEQHAIELLSSYVAKMTSLNLSLATTDSIEAFQYVQKNKVDLVYLDIHMPELDGIQFLKLLGGKSKVILTTAYPEYALEGYEHDIVDYLLKPILFDRFLKATQKAINQLIPKTENLTILTKDDNAKDDYIFVKGESRSKLTKIKLNEIQYIESLGNYVTFYLENSKIITLITIRELQEKLPADLFIRTHKSYVVAINKIEAIEGNRIFVNQVEIPLGETYKEAFFNFINNKILNLKSK